MQQPEFHGRLVSRFVRSLIVAGGDPLAAAAFASGQRWVDEHYVVGSLKALVSAVDTADLASAIAPVAQDLANLLRPQTIIGRMPLARKLPLATRLILQTGGVVAGFVDEGAAIPVAELDFDSPTTLKAAKVAIIACITNELSRMSSPAADALISGDLSRACAMGMDLEFCTPAIAPTTERPGSIFHAAPSLVSTGTTLAAIDNDLAQLLELLTDQDVSLDTAVWIMAPRTASYLSRVRGTAGAPAFPYIKPAGGELLGLQVLASRALEQAGSPGAGIIGLVAQDSVLLGDDGQADISVSTQATLQLETMPTSAAAPQISLFQKGLAAVRAVRYCRWQRRRDTGAAYLSGVSF